MILGVAGRYALKSSCNPLISLAYVYLKIYDYSPPVRRMTSLTRAAYTQTQIECRVEY